MPNPLPPETTPEWTAKLLPCPFCGNASVTARECSDDDDRCAVACDSKASECPMEITVYECYNEEQAVEAWNHRASVPNTGIALSEETRVHGVTWIVFDARRDRVVLERCPKKAKVLGVGEWFIPGGKLEGDETDVRALKREIAEEWPGVEIIAVRPLPILEGSPVPPGPRGLFLMRPFVVAASFDRCADGTLPDVSADGVELRWTPVAEALASPVPQVRMMVAAALQSSAPSPGMTAEHDADLAYYEEHVRGARRDSLNRSEWPALDAEIVRIKEVRRLVQRSAFSGIPRTENEESARIRFGVREVGTAPRRRDKWATRARAELELTRWRENNPSLNYELVEIRTTERALKENPVADAGPYLGCKPCEDDANA